MSGTPDPRDLITLREAVDRWPMVSRKVIRRQIDAGNLRGYHIGRTIYVRRDEVDNLMRPVTPEAVDG